MDRSSETPRGTRLEPQRSRGAEARLRVRTATRRATAWLAMAMAAATLASAAPGTLPHGVSPGTEEGAVIGGTCPTFSWAAVEGAIENVRVNVAALSDPRRGTDLLQEAERLALG